MGNIVDPVRCSVSAVPRISPDDFKYVSDCTIPEAPEFIPECPETFFNAAWLSAQATAVAVEIGGRVAITTATNIATQVAISTATLVATNVATTVINQYFADQQNSSSSSGSSYCDNGDERVVKLQEPFFWCEGNGYVSALVCSRDDTEDETKECPWYSPVDPEIEMDDIRMDFCRGGMFFEDDIVRIRRIDCHWQILNESQKIVKGRLTSTLERKGTATFKVWTVDHDGADLLAMIDVSQDICDTGELQDEVTLPVGCQVTAAWTYRGWTLEGYDCMLEEPE